MSKKKSKYYIRPDGLHEAIRVIDGKRVAFRGKTDREVERKMLEYQEKQETGPLFREVAEKWEVEHFPTLSPSTAKGYQPALKRAINRLGDLPIKEITPADIDALLHQMARQQYAKKTVSNQLLIINQICRFAMLEGHTRYNPATAVRVPRDLHVSKRKIPTEEELRIVKEGWDKPGGFLPFFILYTGCRRGEALALTYKDIDRKRKLITINKAVSYGEYGPVIKKPKTEKGTREIILLDTLVEKLPLGIGDALLFPGKDGKIISEMAFQRRWDKWRKEVGVSLTAHQLRHGYATMLFEAGISERDAMDLLGHTDINLTRNIYTHIRKSRKDETAEKLNAIAEKF